MSFLRLSLMIILTVVTLSAQRSGGGLMGPGAESALPPVGQQLTLAEQLQNQLKLDSTQIPTVDEALQTASRQAAPVAQSMSTVRQGLVNAELRNEPDSAKALRAEYQLLAAKMAAIEVEAFMKIYAVLKSNQQQKADEAFMVMAGMFLPPRASRGVAAGPRTGMRSGGGR